jgi:hypothetical protein
VTPAPTFPRFGKRPVKCRRGDRIHTAQRLARILSTEASIWWSNTHKPMPCVVVANWQWRRVIIEMEGGRLFTVIRPQRAEALP